MRWDHPSLDINPVFSGLGEIIIIIIIIVIIIIIIIKRQLHFIRLIMFYST